MELFVTNTDYKKFEDALKLKIDKAMTEALLGRDINNLFWVESEIITQQLTSSSWWQGLTGDMRGEFGFTDAEMANIKGVEGIMAHDPSITKIIKSGSVGSEKQVTLYWVDFARLMQNPMAIHPLTHWNNGWELTYEVNWLGWLEYGATIHEYVYNPRPKKEDGKSRSNEGIMVMNPGSMWRMIPSKVFHDMPLEYRPNRLADNIGIVLRKRLRQTITR